MSRPFEQWQRARAAHLAEHPHAKPYRVPRSPLVLPPQPCPLHGRQVARLGAGWTCWPCLVERRAPFIAPRGDRA